MMFMVLNSLRLWAAHQPLPAHSLTLVSPPQVPSDRNMFQQKWLEYTSVARVTMSLPCLYSSTLALPTASENIIPHSHSANMCTSFLLRNEHPKACLDIPPTKKYNCFALPDGASSCSPTKTQCCASCVPNRYRSRPRQSLHILRTDIAATA